MKVRHQVLKPVLSPRTRWPRQQSHRLSGAHGAGDNTGKVDEVEGHASFGYALSIGGYYM